MKMKTKPTPHEKNKTTKTQNNRSTLGIVRLTPHNKLFELFNESKLAAFSAELLRFYTECVVCYMCVCGIVRF